MSKLKFVNRGCDLCENKEGIAVYSVPFLGHNFSFVRCSNCGLIYQNPILNKESLGKIYESLEYWEHKQKNGAKSDMLNYYQYLEEENIRRRTAEIRVKWMSSHLKKDARVLDLGCSDGLFVDVLSKTGYKASGIDVSSTMISHGRQTYGVDVKKVDFEDEWPFNERFDAITCYATLSNITNPSRVFGNIRKHLRPGGCFLFNFGDYSRLISRLLGSRLYLYRPTACTIYSRKIVNDYCRSYNLRVREIFNDVQIVPMARLVSFFRVPGLIEILKFFGLEEANFKMTLLTGYAACAVYD